MKEESCKNENALRIARVKERDYLVELEKAENTIKFLTEEQGIKRKSLELNVVNGISSYSKAKVSKITCGPSFFPYNCYFCHTRGHKKAQCAEFLKSCNKKQRKPRGKPRKIRQVWVRKDRLDPVRETIIDGKRVFDMKKSHELSDANGDSTSKGVAQLDVIVLSEP